MLTLKKAYVNLMECLRTNTDGKIYVDDERHTSPSPAQREKWYVTMIFVVFFSGTVKDSSDLI